MPPNTKPLPEAARFDAMIGETIALTIDAKGKVLSIKGVGDMVAVVAKKASMTASEKVEFKEKFSADRLIYDLGALLAMPGKPVAKGDTWEHIRTMPVLAVECKTTHTLASVQGGVATVTFTGAMGERVGLSESAKRRLSIMKMSDLNVAVEGTTRMDAATGMVKTSNVTQKGTFTMVVDDGAARIKGKITFVNTEKTTIEKGAYKPADAAKK